MSRVRNIILFLALVALLALSGCSEQPTPLVAAPTATEYAYPPPAYDPEEVSASLTAMPDESEEAAEPTEDPQTEAPETEPTEAVAAEPEVDNCLECHIDQQTLIDTANPVAEVESENEGEG